MSQYWEPCPRCGSNKVQTNSRLATFIGLGTGLGCLSILIWPLVFLAIPLLIFVPFMKKSNVCQECKHVWKVNKNKKEVSV